MTRVSNLTFAFQPSDLGEELKRQFNESLTGYWKIELFKGNNESRAKVWYIAVVQGRIVFSGFVCLSLHSFIATLKCYLPPLRMAAAQLVLQQVETELSSEQTPNLSKVILALEKKKLLSYDDVVRAMRLRILSDLDTYLFDCSGQADFREDSELVLLAPIRGFELNSLLLEAIKRRREWMDLKDSVPSPDSTFILKPDVVEQSTLTDEKKQYLYALVKEDRPLNIIAYYMGRDLIEVAKSFAILIKRGFIELSPPNQPTLQRAQPPEIFIVDDSLAIVEQFTRLVNHWGYAVKSSNNPLTAVQDMLKAQPSAIFLDINMPGASGFQLIKQIRRHPKLSSIPLVLMTSEKTLSNQWRAQWANCKFLAKPRALDELRDFQRDLYDLLQQLTLHQ